MSALRLSECRLYGILDLAYVDAMDVREVADSMIEGGVDIVQLRGKQRPAAELAELAAQLREVTSMAGVPLVINDHPEIARTIGAEGVHVGQDDFSIAAAREIAGQNCFVGRSTHSFEQAVQAASEGADYIGFGPLFATPTKREYAPIGLAEIARLHEALTLPIFCIGGVKLTNLRDVIAAGAQRVAIVSGLLQAENVTEYARAAATLLNQHSTIESLK